MKRSEAECSEESIYKLSTLNIQLNIESLNIHWSLVIDTWVLSGRSFAIAQDDNKQDS